MTNQLWPVKFDDILRRHLPFLDEADEIPGGVSLFDLGITSAEMIALLTDLEDEFHIEFAEGVLELELFSSAERLWSVVTTIRAGAALN